MAKTQEQKTQTQQPSQQAFNPTSSEANIVEHSQQLVPQQIPAAAKTFLDAIKTKREAPAKVNIISIAHREKRFKLPSGELVEEVSGYPIYYFRTRRWFRKGYKTGEKGQAPDCWSADMVEPHMSSPDKQAEFCSDCPLSQFGTGRDGRSQACGTYVWIFLLNTSFRPLPLAVIQAPPSSLRTLLGTRFEGGYFSQAESRYGCYEIVWTKFKLKVQGEGEQVQYCTLDPIMIKALDDHDKIVRLANFREKFIEKMNEFRLRTSDEQEDKDEPGTEASAPRDPGQEG
jgi:hypothetical protein